METITMQQRDHRLVRSTGVCGLQAIRMAFALCLSSLLAACIADPEIPTYDPLTDNAGGVIVVEQGLRWQGNGGLSFFDPETGSLESNWFIRANVGAGLGDTPNEIVVRGERTYVVVSESGTVEIVESTSGRSLGRVLLPSALFPQHIAFVNDSIAWVTCLDDDAAREINVRSMMEGRRVQVGPAPEGIDIAAGRLFVANSGLAAFRADEPGAGTLSVLDPVSGEELRRIPVGGNLGKVVSVETVGLLYVLERAIFPDTNGGALVEIDPIAMRETRRWSIPGAWQMAFDETGGIAYVLGGQGVWRVNLLLETTPSLLIDHPYSLLDEEVLYGLGVSPGDGTIYLGIVRGRYQAPGRVERYDREGRLLTAFDVGLNPVAFGFTMAP